MSRRAWALAVCWALVNGASITHSAWAFAKLEHSTGWWWVIGLVGALGTDAGMAVLTWEAMQRKRGGGGWRMMFWPVAGVLLAAAAVGFANVAHGFSIMGAWSTLTWWERVHVIGLGLVLPALTVLMSALVEAEHASAHTTTTTEPEVSTPEEPAELPPIRPPNVPLPTADDVRLAHVRAHVATHPLATDVDVYNATGVARSTVGRWRRAGLLDPLAPPTIERNGATPAHAQEV